MIEDFLKRLLGSINSIDPFIVSFSLGLLVLAFFARERVDIPTDLHEGVQKSGDGDAAQDSVDLNHISLLYRLPASVARVRRFHLLAVAVYFTCLALVYSTLCMLFAAELFTNPSFGGGNTTQTQVSSGQTSNLVPTSLGGFEGFIFAESKFTEYPWGPLFLSLGMVGVMPTFPWLRGLERWIRRISLLLAGIPRAVKRLWTSLVGHPVESPEKVLDGVTFQSVDLKELLADATEHYADFTSASTNTTARFRADLAKVLCYHAWTEKCDWPNKETRALIRSKVSVNLVSDVERLIDDIQQLVSLGTVVASARPEVVVGPTSVGGAAHGMGDATGVICKDALPPEAPPASEPEEGTVTETDIDKACTILKKSWQSIQKRIGVGSDEPSGLSELCCLHISLYAENSGDIGNPNDPRTLELRKWIRNARLHPVGGRTKAEITSLLNYMLLCVLVSVALAFTLHLLAVKQSYVVHGPSSTPLAISRAFGLNVAALLLPSLVPILVIRELSDQEGKWRPWTVVFNPPILSYIGFALTAWVFGMLLQMGFLYLAPLIEGIPSQSGRQGSFDTEAWLAKAGQRAAISAVFTVFLSIALDQETRKSRFWLLSFAVLLMQGIAFYNALSFDPAYKDLLVPANQIDLGSPEAVAGYKRQLHSQAGITTACALVMHIMMIGRVYWERKKSDSYE